MNELNKDDIEYIEQAEGIVWRLATIVKANIETLEKIDLQIEHKLPHLRANIEDAILMQMRMYQKVNELFPRLEFLEETYVRNRSNELSLSGKSIKYYAPRIWNIINIVSKLKPASMKDSWHTIVDKNLGISLHASYVRKPIIEEDPNINEDTHQMIVRQTAQDNILEAKYEAPSFVAIHYFDEPDRIKPLNNLKIRGNKKYTDYLRSVGISGQIGQFPIVDTISTSSNLVLKKD